MSRDDHILDRINAAEENYEHQLYLPNLGIKSIPIEVFELSQLNYLNLSENLITEIPREIEWLEELQVLNLYKNRLGHLPSEIKQLRNLIDLRLGKNQFGNIPSILFDLKDLEYLDLSSNSIFFIIPEIQKLRKLKSLDLSNNSIADLPKELLKLTELESIDLRGNPLTIPPEILDTLKPSVILPYYFDNLQKPLNELKVLIVGQGSVGKTSIIRRLLNNTFDSAENKTSGIEINKWQVVVVDQQNADEKAVHTRYLVRINLWDFGGQEIMHATHQFFLTKRSLYLLVLDSRLTQEENRVEYWLKIIQSFGSESPILIICNKSDQHAMDIDRIGLLEKYPKIVDVLETSAATGIGMKELRSIIAQEINKIPHVRDLLPESWFNIKLDLEDLGRKQNYISDEEYRAICMNYQVFDETSQRTLLDFLHDLGVVLHFQDNPRLEALGILNPQWVTDGVYRILNSKVLFQNNGILTIPLLDEILNAPAYPRTKRLFIVDIMKKFELCFDIESDKTFLVPDLLPKDQPDLKFNGIPAFEYAYPVLPSSIITRFIVRMNQHICDGYVWRTGVLLKIGENTALVKADIEDRKIAIAIEGVEHTRRDALSAIRYQLDEIHNSIKGLNPEKFVPIPGAESQRYEFLLQLEHDGIKVLPVPGKGGGKPVMVDISQLLSGIESEAQRRENVTNVTTIYNVNTGGGDFTGRDKSIKAENGGIAIGGNLSGNLISGNYNRISSAEIDPELKDALLQLGDAVNAMLQKLPTEQAAEVAEDYGKLADEAVKPKPNQKWYSVSIEGLIKAAENLDKLGTPVISLSQKVLSLLTGGIVK